MRRLAAIAAWAAVFCGSTGSAWAGMIDPNLEMVLAQPGEREVVSALVYLSDQVDLTALTRAMDRQKSSLQLRHEQVVRSLREVAAASQGDLLAQLKALQSQGSVTSFQPFWIANCIRVEATPEAFDVLVVRADVEMIYYNYEIEPIAPVAAQGPQELLRGRTPETGVQAVRAPDAWALGFTGQDILVATLDTGVDGNHPALADRWRGVADPRYEGHPEWAWFDPVTSTTFPQSFGAHGTHTMGSVCGGAPGDEIGVAPGAQWIHAAVIDRVDIPTTVADAIAAFQWMLDPDGDPSTHWDVPAVCSNSWRVTTGHGYPPCDETFWSYLDACESAGIVILFSAGNEGPGSETVGRPPDRATDEYRTCAVGAVDANNPSWPVADFSSRGPSHCTPDGTAAIKPELVAPGVEVRSSVPGGGYESSGWSGTSMASPHVNGVVALIRQACPDLTVEDVKQVMYDTAYDLGPTGEDNDYGWGMVDAYEAVIMALDWCIPGSDGEIEFDREVYLCEDVIAIEVGDFDLNLDDDVAETVDVTIDSDTEPAGEIVTLTETEPDSARFAGIVALSLADAAGVLQVAEGDTVTATYIDADDGEGGFDVEVTATAVVDCTAPIISNVETTEIEPRSAVVIFDTDEPALGRVHYGTSCEALTETASQGGYHTGHSVELAGLDNSTTYFYMVEAEDEAGNSVTDDSGGDCYSFSTPDVVYNFPLDADPGWTTEGDWAFGQPTGGGSHNGDPTSGYTGVNVYGYNLYGDYPDSLPATYLTTTAIDCTGLTDVYLSFHRWLGVESNSDYDEATIEVSNNGADWTVIWRATDTGADVADTSWQLQEFNISAIADNQGTVYIRWGMGPTDGGLTYPGWNVDDVQIIASGGLLAIGFPEGLPELLPPSEPTDISVRIVEGDESYVADSGTLYYRYYGGEFEMAPLEPLGGELYRATLPPADCTATPEFYFSAEGSESGVIHQPLTAPSATFTAEVGELLVVLEDDFETDQGWTVGDPDDDATTGIWNRMDPEGSAAQPEYDHTPDPAATCWVTDGYYGGSLGAGDVDDGKTTLKSPTIDLSEVEDATISYFRWYSNDTGADPHNDVFVVDISADDGGTWTNVETVGPAGPGTSGGWFYHEFQVADFVTPTSQIKLRFIASDEDSGSLVEAAVDDLGVVVFECSASEGDGDFDFDSDLDLFDFGRFQECFSPGSVPPGCEPGDMDGSGGVDLLDFGLFFSTFGGPN